MFGLRIIRSAFRVSSIKSYRGLKSGSTLTEYYLNGSQVTGGLFDEQIWEEYYTEIIDSQKDKAANAGQETLLGEDYFAGAAKRNCQEIGSDYNPEYFVDRIQDELGDTYFYAINEIIEECSIELLDALDQAKNGIGEGNGIFGSFSSSLNAYQASAASKYGPNWNTYSASAARSRNTATNFLKNNPMGTARSTTSLNQFSSRSYGQRNAISRQTATRFLKNYPNGKSR